MKTQTKTMSKTCTVYVSLEANKALINGSVERVGSGSLFRIEIPYDICKTQPYSYATKSVIYTESSFSKLEKVIRKNYPFFKENIIITQI